MEELRKQRDDIGADVFDKIDNHVRKIESMKKQP
jgi:hypothetical protein